MNQPSTLLRNFDPAFPGESWFFYWKTSASLWREKLSHFPGRTVIVPINWAFHTDTGEAFDFGLQKPEANLVQLASLAEMLEKELIFFLPLTPFPFLPNGGVPHLLARVLALNSDKMAYALWDNEEHIHKLISFFDSRVFQAYRKFVINLGRTLSENQVNAKVWGIEAGYLKNHRFVSYLEDSSSAFDQAFARYLSASKNDPELASLKEGETLSFRAERLLKLKFTKMIHDLYLESAREALSSHWEGYEKVGFLGGASEDLFKRKCQADDWCAHARTIMEFSSRDVLSSSVLLLKKQDTILERQLAELVTQTMLPLKLTPSEDDPEENLAWTPLNLFQICERNIPNEENIHCWKNFGLLEFLDQKHHWSYQLGTVDQFFNRKIDKSFAGISLVHGENLDGESLTQLLKNFMNGGHIILNRSRIREAEQKRLEAFFIENSLEVEKVVFYTPIHNIKLGDGRFLVFDGEKLEELDFDKRLVFWRDLLSTFNIPSLEIKKEDGLEYAWRRRPSHPSELHYEEIRRLSIYNPTSYKKRMVLELPKNFSFLKMVDESSVQIAARPGALSLEFLPMGAVSLDFGIFS